MKTPISSLYPPLKKISLFLARPAEKSQQMKEKLESLGASVVHYSPLIFQYIPPAKGLEKKILHEIEGLIFGSSQGWNFFSQWWEELPYSWEILKLKKIYAIGQKTAQAIEKKGIVWDSLFFHLQDCLSFLFSQESLKKRKKFMRITSLEGMEKIPTPQKYQDGIYDLAIYKSLVNTNLKDRERILKTPFHYAILGSPSCIDAVLEVFGASFLHSISQILVFGNTTQTYLQNLGFSNVYRPSQPTESKLIEWIIQHEKGK